MNEEAERRLLAIFINGLKGNPGLQVRYQMPDTIEKALKIANTVAQAELEKEKEKFPIKVFGVRGTEMQHNKRQNKWGNNHSNGGFRGESGRGREQTQWNVNHGYRLEPEMKIGTHRGFQGRE